MNVSLTPELEKFVEAEVKKGFYQTASEVVRAALRRLREDQDRLPALPKTFDELEDSLLKSIERFESGEGVNGEAAFRRLRKRIKERLADG